MNLRWRSPAAVMHRGFISKKALFLFVFDKKLIQVTKIAKYKRIIPTVLLQQILNLRSPSRIMCSREIMVLYFPGVKVM